MPYTHTEQTRTELTELEYSVKPRERNTDSSVSAQYEDHIPPDNSWQHEDES